MDARRPGGAARLLRQALPGGILEFGVAAVQVPYRFLQLLRMNHAADLLRGETRRALTERALNSIGRHYFSVSVCGDEVVRAKPAPDPYERAAALLGLEPGQCLAIEDSITGAAAAEDAGCPVLVVPNDVEVPATPRRRHVSSLTQVGIPQLREIYAELQLGLGERSA